ncbi:MAG TPA: hypothetical protein VJL61_08715 [Rhodanobacteraceae bacterium]|nr:hypothetical protein [Rhodanobacteraceae bacterium]
MLERQNLTRLIAGRRDFPEGAIGCLGSELPPDGNLCFFTGSPINGPDAKEIVDADAAVQFFPRYDGAFTGIFLDEARRVLVIATDCLGMQPLYMQHSDGDLILASETKAMRGEADLSAWGAFISIGHPIGERSLMQGLVRVPAGSILTYDLTRHRLDISSYWHWPKPSDAWRSYDFLAALERDIRACAAYDDSGTLLLSGGFDSRLLLFLLKRAGIPVDALSIAHEDEHDDADGRLAQAIAERAGVSLRRANPSRDFFSSGAYLDYLAASDAGFPSLDLFIAKVASQIDAEAVWDGLVPGFVFMPLHQPEGGFDAYLKQEIRGADSAIWRAAEILFKPEVVAAMREGFAKDLDSELSRLPHDMHGLARFVIENRSRNRPAMNPLKVYPNRVRAFTPGLSKDFMAHAATIPFREKQHGRFYRNLFARLDKRALSVSFVSGGELLPGNRFSPSYYRERLRAEQNRYRSRYPRLFGGKSDAQLKRSTFLGEHLFEDGDRWLNPSARERLKTPETGDYLAWKLLFHWKAWQWLHEGMLDQALERYGDRCKA